MTWQPPDGTHRWPRGPYGTNEGDVWLATGSIMQDKLDQQGDGLVLIFEMMVKDGQLQECLYTTTDPELIAAAQRGHERWVAQRGMEN